MFGRSRHENENPWRYAPPWAIELREMLRIIIGKESTLMVDYTKLQADITAQTSVLQSLVVGVQGMHDVNVAEAQQVADLKAALAAAGVTDAAVQATVDAIDQSVQNNTAIAAALIPAVTANTPTPPDEAAAAAAAAAPPAPPAVVDPAPPADPAPAPVAADPTPAPAADPTVVDTANPTP